MRHKLDTKYSFVAVSLIVIVLLAFAFWDNILDCLVQLFTTKYLSHYVGGFAAIFKIVRKIKEGKFNFRPSMSFNEFRAPFEELLSLSFFGTPITLFFAISLAKKLFLQTMTDDYQFFVSFESWELWLFAIVCAYLIFISLMDTYNDIRRTVLHVDVEKPMPIPKESVHKEIPDPESK